MSILANFKNLENTHSSLYNELNQELPKLNPESFFDYTKNLTDPFQMITTNPDKDDSILNHLYDWYNSINPNYQQLKTLNPKIPEFNKIQPYRTLLLNMAKDLIILKSTKTFPKPNIPQMTNNNKKKLADKNTNALKKHNKNNKTGTIKQMKMSMISQNNVMVSEFLTGTNHSRTLHKLSPDNFNFDNIEIIITDILMILNNILDGNNILHYNYLEIINIIDKYLQLFSFGENTFNGFKNQLFKYIETPFFIYPTFNPISYTKVIYFIQAPVINFMMMNTRKLVHGEYHFPYHQIYHDLQNHANKTHNTRISENLSDKFLHNNNIINVLKNYINYDMKPFIKSKSVKHPPKNINKFILCYTLFILSHEIGDVDFNSILSFIDSINNYSDLIKRIMMHDLDESLPEHKYDMVDVKTKINEHDFIDQIILQLNNINNTHAGGGKTNTHHKKKKKTLTRKNTNTHNKKKKTLTRKNTNT